MHPRDGGPVRAVAVAAGLVVAAWAWPGARTVAQTAAVASADVAHGAEDPVAEIPSHAGRLGHVNFRTREAATRRLIEIGRMNKTARAAVIAAMRASRRDTDPEVSERARHVLSILDPPPARTRSDVDGLTHAS